MVTFVNCLVGCVSGLLWGFVGVVYVGNFV